MDYTNYTDRARRILQLANQESIIVNHDYIGTEHILLATVKNAVGLTACLLKGFNIDLHSIQTEIKRLVNDGPDHLTQRETLPFTKPTKRLLEQAQEEATRVNSYFIDSEHILLALLTDRQTVATSILNNFDMTLESARDMLDELLDHNVHVNDTTVKVKEIKSGMISATKPVFNKNLNITEMKFKHIREMVMNIKLTELPSNAEEILHYIHKITG